MEFDIGRFLAFIALPILPPVLMYAVRKLFKRPQLTNPAIPLVILYILMLVITLPALVSIQIKIAALVVEAAVYFAFWSIGYAEYKQNKQTPPV